MKSTTLLFALLFVALFAPGQSLADVFNNDTKITWLGIDYSQAKLIGEWSQFNGAGDYSPAEVRDKYFPAWNHLLLEEAEKYDLKDMIRQDDIYIDIGMVMERNSAVSRRDLESYNPPNYTAEQIQGFVSSYDLEGKSGIGMVLINEYMSKHTDDAVYHFVLLDLATKNVLLHEKISSTPRGFGIRNYWGGSIYHLIQDVEKNYYARWKHEYGG